MSVPLGNKHFAVYNTFGLHEKANVLNFKNNLFV